MPEYSPVTRARRWRLAPRPGPTLALAAALAVSSVLGVWQLDRAAGKRALFADFARAGPAIELSRLPADAARYQRVVARGHYDPLRQFLHDNRVHAGMPGVHVLTPFVLADGSAVLVNRGWRPLQPARRELPAVSVATDARIVSGRIDRLPETPIELPVRESAGWPKLVQYPRMDELAAALGRELQPRVILLDPWEPDGYVREWAAPGTPPARHLAYAVQWFALAGVAVVVWVVFSRRRPDEPA